MTSHNLAGIQWITARPSDTAHSIMTLYQAGDIDTPVSGGPYQDLLPEFGIYSPEFMSRISYRERDQNA